MGRSAEALHRRGHRRHLERHERALRVLLRPPRQGLPAPSGGRTAGLGPIEGSTLPDDARHGARRHLRGPQRLWTRHVARRPRGPRAPRAGAAPLVLTRAAFAGIQRYAAVWTGDFASNFTHLEASILMLIGLGLLGRAVRGRGHPGLHGARERRAARALDAGGAVGSAEAQPRGEGERRRRSPGASASCTSASRARRSSGATGSCRPCTRSCTRRRRRGCRSCGRCPSRSPDDLEALHAFDQLLFGGDLLVAPVARPGQSKRLAYLPAGAWMDFREPGARGERGSGAGAT